MWKMLKHIGQTHRRKLITTFSLVGLDNLLLLVYPVFGGWAINAVMEGKVWQAMLYGVVVLLMWIIGAARRIADTRTFTQIYTEIAVPVVLEQRKREVPHSAITARVAQPPNTGYTSKSRLSKPTREKVVMSLRRCVDRCVQHFPHGCPPY